MLHIHTEFKEVSMSSGVKFLSIAVLTIIAVGAYMVFGAGQGKAPANAQGGAMMGGAPQAAPVTTIRVEAQPVEVWNNFSARLTPVDRAEIHPRVSGTITKVHFKDGDSVKKGESLFTIDSRPFRASVGQSNAALVAANTDLKLKTIELERAKTLIKSRAIPQRVYDERVNSYNIAKATREGAFATLEKARLDVEYANVRAPISGRTGRVELTEGNVVTAGGNAPLLTTIVSDSHVYADFEVDEATYVALVRAGLVGGDTALPVHLFLTGSTKADYQGEIYNFDNRIDPASGTIRARAKFSNDDGALIAGMFASVSIQGAGGGEQIAIPEKAVGTDQDRKFVYIVNDDNMSEYREIKIGAATEAGRIVLSGLSEGEVIITEGISRIRPNMPVDTGKAAKPDSALDAPPAKDAMPLLEDMKNAAPEEEAQDAAGKDPQVAPKKESRFLDSSGAEVTPEADPESKEAAQ